MDISSLLSPSQESPRSPGPSTPAAITTTTSSPLLQQIHGSRRESYQQQQQQHQQHQHQQHLLHHQQQQHQRQQFNLHLQHQPRQKQEQSSHPTSQPIQTQQASSASSSPPSPHLSNHHLSPKETPRPLLQSRANTNPPAQAVNPLSSSSSYFRLPDAKRTSIAEGTRLQPLSSPTQSPINLSPQRNPSISSQRHLSVSSRAGPTRTNSFPVAQMGSDSRRPSSLMSRANSLADITSRNPPNPELAPATLFFEDEDDDEEISDVPPVLDQAQVERLGVLMDRLESLNEKDDKKDGDASDVPTFAEFAECIAILRQGYIASDYSPNYDFRNILQEERERMLDLYPMTEEMWLQWLTDQERPAQTLDEKVALMELWSKSVSQETSSIPLWRGYIKFILRIWRDSAKTAKESEIEEDDGYAEVFTYDLVVKVLRQAVTAVAYCVPDSHLIWDKYRDLVSLELDTDTREVRSTKIEYVHNLYIARLSIPHLTIESTFSSFSSFVSTYQSPDSYESIMSEANKVYQQTKRKVEEREPFEARLNQTRDTAEEGQAWSDYLEWEKTVTPKKKLDIQACLSLYERCILRYPMESKVWEEYMFFALEKCGNDMRILPLFERATAHCQWSGTLWAHQILAMEKRFKTHALIEAIKHKATESRLLVSQAEVFQVHLAWCGFLKRMGLTKDAHDNDMDDFAELGLRGTLNEIGQLDEDYRIARLLISFLTQKGNVNGAREEWKKLMKAHSKKYEFWVRYYQWALSHMDAAFAGNVLKQGSNSFKEMDWPEKILEMYQVHVSEYGTADEIEEAEVRIRRLRKSILERREFEQYTSLQQQQHYQHEEAHQAEGANGEDNEVSIVNGKRRRDSGVEDNRPVKRARSEDLDHEMTNNDDKVAETAEEMEARLAQELQESNAKRNRERNTVLVKNLAPDVQELDVRKFFRDCGTINSFHLLVEKDGKSSTASIEFEKQEDVLAAQTRDGKTLAGRPMVIQIGLGTTVYLTNYPPTADKSWIMDFFKSCGKIVDVRLPSLKYRHHGRFCYIQFADAEGAEKATHFDGQVVGKTKKGEDMRLQAKISNPAKKQERSSPAKEGREIFVTNLDFNAKEADLRTFFERWEVESVRIPTKPGGRHRGFGFVVFRTADDADQAVTMDDQLLLTRNVKVVKSDDKAAKTSESGTMQLKGVTDSLVTDAESPTPSVPTPMSTNATPPPPPSKEAIAAKTLYVLNVADTINDSRLRALFEKHGAVRKVLLKSEHQGAIVEYESVANAGQATLALDGYELEGKTIRFGTYGELMNSEPETKPKAGENPFAKKKTEQLSAMSLAPQRVQRPGTNQKKRGGLGYKGSIVNKNATKEISSNIEVIMKDEGSQLVPKTNDQFREMFVKK